MSKNTAKTKVKKLDKLDCQIVNLLQKDGRLSNTSIAKELGIAEATVRTRLKRLINEKYIKIVAVGDPHKLGFSITGNIKIRIDTKKKDNVVQELSKLKEAVYINLMTGSMDVDIDFIVRSLDQLNDLIYNHISKIDGIINTETSLIMKQVKENYAWGTAYDED
ncbi:Lrp/AsnC family transcriptional regulator [bacterium]|nr:Lrp/AsnC family transcriptional regulator [bacterium]